MAHDGPPHDGAPHRLTPVYQTACRDARRLHRPSIQPLWTQPWGHRAPDGNGLSGHAWWAVGLALGLVLTVVCAHAADTFHRLSAQEIRAKIIGNVITDDTHWSQHFRPDGTLQSIVLSQLKQGTWKINGNALCLTLKMRKQETTTECYEV